MMTTNILPDEADPLLKEAGEKDVIYICLEENKMIAGDMREDLHRMQVRLHNLQRLLSIDTMDRYEDQFEKMHTFLSSVEAYMALLQSYENLKKCE